MKKKYIIYPVKGASFSVESSSPPKVENGAVIFGDELEFPRVVLNLAELIGVWEEGGITPIAR